MALKKGAEALEFIREEVRRDHSISFKEVQEKATKRGFKIYPIMYGRAKNLEGLTKSKPKKASGRGPGRPPGKRGPGRPPLKRGPGRPPKVISSGLATFDALISSVREGDRERERYRGALEKISRILEEML